MRLHLIFPEKNAFRYIIITMLKLIFIILCMYTLILQQVLVEFIYSNCGGFLSRLGPVKNGELRLARSTFTCAKINIELDSTVSNEACKQNKRIFCCDNYLGRYQSSASYILKTYSIDLIIIVSTTPTILCKQVCNEMSLKNSSMTRDCKPIQLNSSY